MALVDAAAIANALTSFFHDDITSNINRSTVLPQILDVRPGTGKNIQWVNRFGTAVPSTLVLADGADVTTFNNDDKIPAVLQYGTYNDAFSVTGKAMAAAQAARNPNELTDLFRDEFEDSIERLAHGMASHFYVGTGATDNIHGLTATAGGVSATGIYAGIDRAGQAQWASNETDLLSAALTLAAMRGMRNKIYTASGMKIDVIVCDPATHDKYGQIFDPERRYIQDVRLRGENIKLDGGYQVLEFDGIPVIEDINCPADTMVFLNTRKVHLAQLPDMSNAANGGLGSAALVGTPEEQFGAPSAKLSARINPLSKTGDAHKFQLVCYPQIVVRQPNCCGKIINIG